MPCANSRSDAELTAYASFLLSEKNRHLKDIRAINTKLEILERKGYKAVQEGDWIDERELGALPRAGK